MSGTSVRVKLERHIIDRMKQDNPLFSGKYTDIRVSGIEGAVGPFASEEDWARAVNQALAFHNEVLCVYDLGESIPLVVAAKGSHPVGNGRCDEHMGQYDREVEAACVGCQQERAGVPDRISYNADCYGFKTLGEALVMALALRDRGNPNDASATASCIQRVLKG